MRKNVLRTALVLISAAVMVYAAHRIYQEHSEYREGADSYSVLEAYIKETQTEPMPEESKPEQDEMSENAIAWPVVDFAALESINSDCVAWIRIDGTEIDYPVVQGHDNSFYLRAVVYEDDHFPAINIYWDCDGGKASELLCFAEYNSERDEGAQVCIGTYVSDEDETQYYAPYMAERNNEP